MFFRKYINYKLRKEHKESPLENLKHWCCPSLHQDNTTTPPPSHTDNYDDDTPSSPAIADDITHEEILQGTKRRSIERDLREKRNLKENENLKQTDDNFSLS